MRYLIFLICFIPTLLLAQSQGGSGVDNTFRLPYSGSIFTDFSTNASGYLNIAPSGQNVGINVTPAYNLDIAGNVLNLGSDAGLITRTNNIQKNNRLVMPHYSNSEVPFAMFNGATTATQNLIAFGGASSSFTAAQEIWFYTTALNSTRTGTERMIIKSDGKIGISQTNPRKKLDILDASAAQLRLTYTDNSVYTDFQTDSSGRLIFNSTGNEFSPSAPNSEALGNTTNYWSIVNAKTFRGPGGTVVFDGNPTATTAGEYILKSAALSVTNTSGTRKNISLNTSFAPTSGTGSFMELALEPTINQTGGANGNYTVIYSNVTETAVGGTGKLIDMNVGTNPKFSVSNVGQVTAAAGIQAAKVTGDPCGTYPEGSIFYNDTSDYYCFCTGAGADKQLHSPATDCF